MSLDKPTFRELIDACRPGSDDLHLPEIAPLAEELPRAATLGAQFDRSRRLDSVIRDGIGRGPVPEGLADRLLAAFAEAPPSEAILASATCDAALDAPKAENLSAAPPANRRWWHVVAASFVVVAAAVLLVVGLLPSDAGPVTERDIHAQVPAWTAAIERGHWRTTNWPAERFPPTQYVPLQPRGWQQVSPTPATDEVVCYDLTTTDRGQILLFIMATSRRIDLPSRPARPFLDTQGLCVGAWQEQDRVYALAVEGNARRYQQVIRMTPNIAAAVSETSRLGQS